MSEFKPIRRKDRILSEDKTLKLLESGEYGFLSVGTDTDGYAYGVPLNFVYDKESNAIYFHCAPEEHKLEILQLNNKISFCIVGHTLPVASKFTTKYESIIAFGVANIQLSDNEKREGLLKLVKKYSPEHVVAGKKYIESAFHRTFVFKLQVEHIAGKSNE